MICIKFYRPHGGHVARLNRDEARRIVASGVAMFAPKHWWRAANLKEAET